MPDVPERPPGRVPKNAGEPPKRSPGGRREFLRVSGAAVAATATVSAAPAIGANRQAAGGSEAEQIPGAVLDALAETVLPSELGEEGRTRAVRDFVRWLDGFEAVAELPHPYLSSHEVRYGPPDPKPMWASQLAGLDLLSERRFGVGFAALPIGDREDMATTAAGNDITADGRMPTPGEAPHVVIGLLAWFYGRPQAADLAYRARIGAAACRDLEGGAEEPASLPAAEARDI